MQRPIPPPTSLQDLLANPQRVADAFALLNAVAAFQASLEPPTGGNSLNRGKIALVGDPPNLTLRLPFKWTSPIADPINNLTATNQAVKDILAQMRLTGINPNP